MIMLDFVEIPDLFEVSIAHEQKEMKWSATSRSKENHFLYRMHIFRSTNDEDKPLENRFRSYILAKSRLVKS
jgi:hypothetical protein